MTTVTDTTFRPATPFRRIYNVAKLHMANPWSTILMPWMILGIIFLANLVIWWLIFTVSSPEAAANASEGMQYSGASSYIFVYMTIVGAMSMSATFPFALGYGVTRRDFYLGSSLAFVGLAAMYAIGLTILASIEEATGGWGLGGHMFTAIYFGETWPQRLFIFFVALLFFFFMGAAISTVWVRWKAMGVTVFFIALGFLIIAAVAAVTLTKSWGAVGQFFGTVGLTGGFALSLIITVIAAVAGFFILRGATPRS